MLLLYNLLNLANKSCLRSISKCINIDTRIYYEFLMHDCPFLKYMLKKQSGESTWDAFMPCIFSLIWSQAQLCN